MKRIFYIGDAHIRRCVYQTRPAMAGDSYRALISIVDDIIAHEADEKALVMCGDVLDQITPEPEDIYVLTSQLQRLREVGIPVYAIEGNHDTVYNKPSEEWEGGRQWAEVIEPIQHAAGRSVNILGSVHYFMSYVYGSKIYEILEKVPECDVLIIHQPMDYLSPFEAFTIGSDDIPATVHKMVVAGHVHTPDVRNILGIKVVSPGCTHIQRFTHEPGSYYSFDPDNDVGEHVKVKGQRIFLRFDLREYEGTVKDLIEQIKNTVKHSGDIKPAVNIKFGQEHIQMLEDIKTAVASEVHLFDKRTSDNNAVVVLASTGGQDTDFKELMKLCGQSLSIEPCEQVEEIVLAAAYNESEGDIEAKINSLVEESK